MTERLPALTLPATPGQADAAIADLLDACAEAYAQEPGADFSRIEARTFGRNVLVWEVPPVAPDLPTAPAPTTPDDVPEAIADVLGAVSEVLLGTVATTPYEARMAAYGRVLAHLRPRLERQAKESRP